MYQGTQVTSGGNNRDNNPILLVDRQSIRHWRNDPHASLVTKMANTRCHMKSAPLQEQIIAVTMPGHTGDLVTIATH